jgi:hypothetical protein
MCLQVKFALSQENVPLPIEPFTERELNALRQKLATVRFSFFLSA